MEIWIEEASGYDFRPGNDNAEIAELYGGPLGGFPHILYVFRNYGRVVGGDHQLPGVFAVKQIRAMHAA